jgi:hypothetical protein
MFGIPLPLFIAMTIFPLCFYSGFMGALILFNMEDYTNKQLAFMLFIGGPILWIVTLACTIWWAFVHSLQILKKNKLAKWVWNDILG